MMPPRNQAGFTLLEMMVALFIFAILAVSATMLLRSSVNAQDSSSRHLDELSELRRFSALVTADLSQIVARTYRDQDGLERPAFSSQSGRDNEPIMTFTRGGRSNLDDAAHSNLLRLEYWIVNGQLQRKSYAQSDGGSPTEPATILRGITTYELRYRTRDGNWRDRWESGRSLDVPRAVELTLAQNDGPALVQVFLVGSGY